MSDSRSIDNVTEILPLTVNQNSFLLHHLSELQEDSGIIEVVAQLQGELDRDLLQKAWDLVTVKHPSLRSSIHWKSISTPVQVVHGNVESTIEFDKPSGLNKLELNRAPISKIWVEEHGVNRYELHWLCHHILLDGWSSSIVLNDMLEIYAQLFEQSNLNVESLKSNKIYNDWLSAQDRTTASDFWRQTLGSKPESTNINASPNRSSSKSFNSVFVTLSESETSQIKELVRKNKSTDSSFFTNIWSLCLQILLDQQDVSFGMVVSGRSVDVPDIQELSGLFTNIIPYHKPGSDNISFQESLGTTRKALFACMKYEWCTLDEICDWINMKSGNWFNSLFVFENFPSISKDYHGLELLNVKSGFSTAFPINFIIKPLKEGFHLELMYDESYFSEKAANELLNLCQELTLKALAEPASSWQEIKLGIGESGLGLKNLLTAEGNGEAKNSSINEQYVPPSNPMQLELVKIWEELLGRGPIGIEDDFFQLGGSSVQAIRLISRIEDQLEHKLSPALLMNHSTIASLQEHLSGGSDAPKWSYINPLRASGSKNPIFCIHAGGGFTFFYNLLADHLSEEQPIYSIQPTGTASELEFHESIEAMSRDYLKEILEVCNEGPIVLVVYCFSIAVGLEIRRQAKQFNREVIIVNVDTDFPHHVGGDSHAIPNFAQKVSFWLRRGPIHIGRKVLGMGASLLGIKTSVQANHESNLDALVGHLQELYTNYSFDPVEGGMIYIRSTQFYKELGNKDLERWQTLFDSKIEEYVIPGEHRTIFERPTVIQLAETLTKVLK